MAAELEKIDYDDTGGFRADYISDTDGFWHFHPEYEIMLNTKSNGTRIVGDSVEIFDHYDLVLIGGNIPHCWNYYRNEIPDSKVKGIMLHFKLSSLGEALLSQHELHSVRKLLMESDRGILFSVEDAKKTESHLVNMVHNKGIEKMISFFNVLKIMCSSDIRSQLCTENYKRAFDERGNKKMTDVFNYVRENYSRPITLQKVSMMTHLSPFAFSRYFKKYSGTGFVEYLNKVRMNKAGHLLRETEYQVHEIASQCGFSSISNFNKQFRRAEGLAPRDYRDRFK
jgi:YesN/AraC family two-component response regulator